MGDGRTVGVGSGAAERFALCRTTAKTTTATPTATTAATRKAGGTLRLGRPPFDPPSITSFTTSTYGREIRSESANQQRMQTRE